MPPRAVEVVEPDPSWPARFEAERYRLREALGRAGLTDEVVAVEHVGSTAVPGLAAKPVIDIAVGLRAHPAPPALIATLEGLGYVHRGEAEIIGRDYLQDAPPGAPRTRQIHVITHGGRLWRDYLRFRDHLRTHVDDRDTYAEAKRRAARDHPHDIRAYMESKHACVRHLLARARHADAEPGVAEVATAGFSDPGRYERARPSYSRQALDWLVNRVGLGSSARVADIGAGTGKLTRMLADTGAAVVAVEPVTPMREHLAASAPGIEVLDGTAEDLPLGSRSVDVASAGQSFHWFDPAAALTEAYRVLRPGGVVALLWNAYDEDVPWVAAWGRLSDRLRGKAPDRRTSPWPEVVAGTALFDGPETATFDNPQEVTREMLVELMASTSFVAALDDEQRAAVLAEARELLEGDPALRDSELVTVPYRTEVHLLHRVP